MRKRTFLFSAVLSGWAVFALLTAAVQTGEAQDGKVSIGIGEIKSTIRNADPGNFQTMLETELIKTNKFMVVERDALMRF